VKRMCTLCGRTSEDSNLWCQELDCPAEDMPIVFGHGQFLGDVEVIRFMRMLRTAALYEAERGEERILLKVAHHGAESKLRREADVLRHLQTAGATKTGRSTLPTLLPAYAQSTIDRHAYGKAIVEGETVYYVAFRFIEGEFLRDILIRNPQPWYEHVAWLTITLAETITYFNNSLKRLHLLLSPEVVFVREDIEGIPRPVLLDLGMLINDTQPEHLEWLHYYGLPSYTAPELTYTTADTMEGCLPATPASDVYGLGLLLYEMLAGQPVYEHRLERDSQVREAVRHYNPPPLTRSDLPDEVHAAVERALNKSPRSRYPDVPTFAAELQRFFGKVPAEKTRPPGNRRLVIAAALAALLLSILILLAAYFG
jgi:serine/threonine protein kinase